MKNDVTARKCVGSFQFPIGQHIADELTVYFIRARSVSVPVNDHVTLYGLCGKFYCLTVNVH